MTASVLKLTVFCPHKIFLMGGGLYFFIWLLAPIDYSYEGGDFSVLVFFAYIFIFCFGLFLSCGRMRGKVLHVHFNVSLLRRLTWLVFFLGMSGLVLRVFERIFIRAGGNISSDFMANREMIASGGMGSVALVGALLSSMFLFLPFLIVFMRSAGIRRVSHFPMLILSAVFAVFDVVLQGSRSGMVIFMAVCLLSVLMTGYIKISLRSVFLGVVAAIALVWFAGMVFWVRTVQMGVDPIASMELSGYARFAPASEGVVNYLTNNGSAGISGVIYAFTHFAQYVTHGVYEFFYLCGLTDSATTYGLQSFYIPSKIVMSLAEAGKIEDILTAGVVRPGVYTTLFGPVLYDFGPLGAGFACLLFAIVIGMVARNVMNQKLYWLPMYLIFCAFIPFFAVVNLFSTGLGQYAMIAALLLGVIMRLCFSKLFLKCDPCG
ncbi:hypothetical protein VP02_08340 [Pseudomonas ogarae]|uniref:Oligosaccharide repeat unit polymerase n=1 Tax=Pseudomonas kilonensis TaxID=132476 RepID=A0A0F4XS06_9PSED|nr:hypothetical protein [Pseudomonas ogarae]KKA08689.1 hypothetical protein VP02_08340 [Pseudomonas ogarae]